MSSRLLPEVTPPRRDFTSKLIHAELRGLRLLIEALEAYDEKSEEDFSKVISVVLAHRFNQVELAEEFKVSIGTISRWKSAKSCPPSYARGVIVDTLCNKLVAEVNRTSKEFQMVG